jgi:hypothetical protein
MIKKKLRKSSTCLNCGFAIEDYNFCPECGQMNNNKHVSVRYFFKDFFDEFFTFDSRFFKSFVPLIRRPGHLTNEYTAGRRVRYVLPLRLYLFVTFLFFLVLSIDTQFVNVIPEQNFSSKETIEKVLAEEPATVPDSLKEKLIAEIDNTFFLQKKYVRGKVKIGIGAEGSWLHRYLKEKTMRIAKRGKSGLKDVIKEGVNQLPKMIFLLLPMFALILKLVYIRNKIFYIKHLVFALHIHTVIFMVYLVFIFFPLWYVVTAGMIGIYIYIFMALRKVYGQGKIKTFLKLNLILMSYLLLLPVGLVILFVLTIVSI